MVSIIYVYYVSSFFKVLFQRFLEFTTITVSVTEDAWNRANIHISDQYHCCKCETLFSFASCASGSHKRSQTCSRRPIRTSQDGKRFDWIYTELLL